MSMAEPGTTDRSYRVCLVLVLIVSACWIIRYPTEFGFSDQEALLPHIHRLMDADFLPDDPFVEGGSQHVVFVHAVAAIGRHIGIQNVMYGVRVVSVLAAMSVLLVACRILTGRSVVIFVLLTLLLGERVFASASGYHFLSPFGTPVGLAWPACFLSLLLVVDNRPRAASVALTVGTLFHPIVACHTLFGVFAIVLFDGRVGHIHRRLMRVLPLVVAFVVGAIPLMWFAMSQPSGEMGGSEFVEIFCRTRHPHHTMISTWGFLRVMRLVLNIVLGVSGAAWLALSGEVRCREIGRKLLVFLAALAVISIGGYVGIEHMQLRLAAVTYPYRCLVFFNVIGTLCVAAAFAELLVGRQSPLELRPARLIALTAMLGTAGFLWIVHPGIASLVWQVGGALVAWTGFSLVSGVTRRVRSLALIAAMGCAALLFVFNDTLQVGRRLTATQWTPIDSELDEAYDHVRDVVDPGDMVLVSPTVRGFRAHAHRTPFFGWKCFPFKSVAAREWYARYCELTERATTLGKIALFCRERQISWIFIDITEHAPEGTSEARIHAALSAIRPVSTWFNGRYALIEIG